MLRHSRARVAMAVALVVVAAVVIGAACGGDGDESENGGATPTTAGPPPEVRVVTTLPIFADFVKEAGRERVEVHAVLGDGIDRSLLELSEEEIERIGAADLVLYNGIDLEAGVEDLLFQHKRRGSQIVSYANDVESPTQEGISAAIARDDPYLWLDPVFAITYVDTSWDSLVIVDGEAAATYQSNANEYKAQLRTLHEEIQGKLAAISPEDSKIVAFHESFLHFANRYGFEYVQMATPISTDEPSPRRIEELAALLRDQGVAAAFAPPGFESPLLREAARRAEVEVCALYSDSFDETVTTYIEMMTFNADELVRCLSEEG